MRLLQQHTRILIATLAAMLAIAVTPSSAHPTAQSDVQAQIEAHLAQYPGGKQINATEISYADGSVVVTFVQSGPAITGPDCPWGWFCFYDHLNYGYPRGRLSSCGWQDLAWWGWTDRTESAHYNIYTGSVTFINHGAYPNHGADDAIFSIGPHRRAIGDVAPYRNAADHVYRYC